MAAAGTARCLQALDFLQELQPFTHNRSAGVAACSYSPSSPNLSKPLRFACNANLDRKHSSPAFLAGRLPVPSPHQNRHRFLLHSKNGGRTAYAEKPEKKVPSVSSAASDLNDRDRGKKGAGNEKSAAGDGDADGSALASGGALAGVLLVVTLATMAGLGFVYKDQINAALIQFQGILESRCPAPASTIMFPPRVCSVCLSAA